MLAGKRTATAYVPRTGAAGPWLSPFQMPLLGGGSVGPHTFRSASGLLRSPVRGGVGTLRILRGFSHPSSACPERRFPLHQTPPLSPLPLLPD